MWRSIIVFIFAYVAIASGRWHKAIVALLAGCILITLGGVSQQAAYEGVDLNVIFLLLGMMILVDAIAQTGFFQWMAIALAKATRGNPVAILVSLICATALVSAFLDNVTTVLLMAPVTILLADQLEIDCIPFLVMEAIASNIGGAATLIGHPPNVLIGSRVGLSFNSFLLNLAPIVTLCFAATAVGVWLVFRRRLLVPEDIRARVRDADLKGAITDRRKAVILLVIVALTLVGFAMQDMTGLAPSVVALMAAMVALIVTKHDAQRAFAAVDWPTLMFFVGLFILVAGLQERSVLGAVAQAIIAVTKGNLLLVALLVMWMSAIAAALMDNIPFVAAMIPVIHTMIPVLGAQIGLQDPAQIDLLVGRPLWWSLALGAAFGSNATPVGASANVVIVGVAERHGRHISFGRFARYGVPSVVGALVICSFYIYLRYFLLAPWPAR